MSSTEFSSGKDYHEIENKKFENFITDKGNQIAIGLDKSGIPYSAKFNENSIFLVYDENFSDSVYEIVKKVSSGEYEELIRKINDKQNISGFLVLLPEIAGYLHTTVGMLEKRPVELLETICKLYVNLWFCDTQTIQYELSKILTANHTVEQNLKKFKAKKQREIEGRF